jgi:CTD small phosphatase-like protein 2
MRGSSEVLIYVKTRPYLKEVLRELRKEFELILFTSGSRAYANAIINEVIEENDDFFDYVITREHCLVDKKNGITVKDLDILMGNRQIKDIIIVDNCSKCYIKHIENGIPIPTYDGTNNDKYLILLKNYLLSKIKGCDDVREILKVDFRLVELREELKEDLKRE